MSASNIRADVETRPPQLQTFLYFSPAFLSLTFYVPPSPTFARVFDTMYL